MKSRARKYDVTKEGDVHADTCIICFDSFKNKNEQGEDRSVAELNCANKHIFHVDCLSKWLEVNQICPICRETIDPDNRWMN